jgi:hypothetical protein
MEMESLGSRVNQNITMSSEDVPSSEIAKRLQRKSDSKSAKRRSDRSASSESDRIEKKDRKRIKKRRKEKKHKEEKKQKKKSKHRSRIDDEESSSSSGEDDAPRSVISGKRIKMHVEKTKDDMAQGKMRKDLLKFMNSSV